MTPLSWRTDIRNLSVYKPGIYFDIETKTWIIPFVITSHYVDKSNNIISSVVTSLGGKGLNSTVNFCGTVSIKSQSQEPWPIRIHGYDDNHWYEALPRWLVIGKTNEVRYFVDQLVVKSVAGQLTSHWKELYSLLHSLLPSDKSNPISTEQRTP